MINWKEHLSKLIIVVPMMLVIAFVFLICYFLQSIDFNDVGKSVGNFIGNVGAGIDEVNNK